MNDIYTDQSDSNQNFNKLDALFAQARATEPVLMDENFTKVVLNSLPTNINRRRDHRRYYPDFIGLMIGIVAVLMLIEPESLMAKVAALVPSSIVISAPNLIGLTLSLSALALVAWWSVERNN